MQLQLSTSKFRNEVLMFPRETVVYAFLPRS